MSKPVPPCLLCGGVMEPFPNHPVAMHVGQSISVVVCTYRCDGCGFLRFYDKDKHGVVAVSSPDRQGDFPQPPPPPPDA